MMALTRYLLSACLASCFFTVLFAQSPTAWLRINQLGYLEQDTKIRALLAMHLVRMADLLRVVQRFNCCLEWPGWFDVV